MPIFISYSHEDSIAVDRLAGRLVQEKVNVWLDRWELHVGDSLIARIQAALTDASALLVVLSKASVQSEWCKKELTSGLLRELEERRVVVLPVLIEDCEIPLFLRDKLYADLRRDFSTGFNTIIESIARVTNEWMNRVKSPASHTDWAIDWYYTPKVRFLLRLTMIEHCLAQSYSILSVAELVANADATQWYTIMAENDADEIAREQIMLAFTEAACSEDITVRLKDQFELENLLPFTVEYGGFDAVIASRRLGQDPGRDVLFYLGARLGEIRQQMLEAGYRPK